MSVSYLIDTNVIVDYLRGKTEALTFLEGLDQRTLISSMTVAELYAGVRDGEERERMEAFLRAFEVVPVTEAVAQQGGLYRRDYGPSHGTDLIDAIIGAAAQEKKARLVTLNSRHFPMLSCVLVPYGQEE